jgi:DNA replication protein DnaC
MTNFAAILNDLTVSFDGRNAYLERLNRCRLLILDDFGMERGTEYALEQVYNVIESRTRSGRPLIVTTNLSLSELQNPTDTAHARIYDRVLELCIPICFTGESMRRARAGTKMDRLKTMMQESVNRADCVNKEESGNTI